jgi:hypothetical protein
VLNDTSLNLDNVVPIEGSVVKRRKLNERSMVSEEADFDLERALYKAHLDLSKEREASRRQSQESQLKLR